MMISDHSSQSQDIFPQNWTQGSISRIRMKLKLLVIGIAGLLTMKLQATTLEKRFTSVSGSSSFYDAQNDCRNISADLITIESQQENKMLSSYYPFANSVWLGLYDNMSSWTWSLNEAPFDNGLDFSHWAHSKPQLTAVANICVSMAPNGNWSDDLCTKTLPAVCYYVVQGNDRNHDPPQYILVTTPKTWDQAQLYCRTNYTDLASARDLTENGDISTLLTEPSWIGLHRQGWGKWSDQTPRTYNNFRKEDLDLNQTSSEPVNCAVVKVINGQWRRAPCASSYEYSCQYYAHAPPLGSRNIIKLKFQSGTDLNDTRVGHQILHQLYGHLGKGVPGELRLRWIHSDGQVFHMETEKNETQGVDCRGINITLI